MKHFFTLLLTLFLLHLNAQIKVEKILNIRDYTKTINHNKLLILNRTVNHDSTIAELYNFYGELLAKNTIPFYLPRFSNHFFANNNKYFAHVRANDRLNYLLELDENLNYLNKYPLDSTLYQTFDNINILTPYLDKLYGIFTTNYLHYLIEMNNQGKVLNKILLPISSLSSNNYDQLEIINGKLLGQFSNPTASYLITTNGNCKPINLLQTSIFYNIKEYNNYIYTAANVYNKTLFTKLNENGDLVDSFSFQFPDGKNKHSFHLVNNGLVRVFDEIFYYSISLADNQNRLSYTNVIYSVNFKNKKIAIFKLFDNNEKVSYQNCKAHFDGNVLAYTYNKIISNDTSLNKVFYSVIEFANLPNNCQASSFPNPSGKQFSINSPWFTEKSLANIEMYNSEGKLCFNSQVITSKNNAILESNVTNGIYFTLITVNGKTCSFKQLIQE